MFDSLTDKLQGVFRRLGGRGTITEKDLDEALREGDRHAYFRPTGDAAGSGAPRLRRSACRALSIGACSVSASRRGVTTFRQKSTDR